MSMYDDSMIVDIPNCQFLPEDDTVSTRVVGPCDRSEVLYDVWMRSNAVSQSTQGNQPENLGSRPIIIIFLPLSL